MIGVIRGRVIESSCGNRWWNQDPFECVSNGSTFSQIAEIGGTKRETSNVRKRFYSTINDSLEHIQNPKDDDDDDDEPRW